jgi:hypothetical protein
LRNKYIFESTAQFKLRIFLNFLKHAYDVYNILIYAKSQKIWHRECQVFLEYSWVQKDTKTLAFRRFIMNFKKKSNFNDRIEQAFYYALKMTFESILNKLVRISFFLLKLNTFKKILVLEFMWILNELINWIFLFLKYLKRMSILRILRNRQRSRLAGFW